MSSQEDFEEVPPLEDIPNIPQNTEPKQDSQVFYLSSQTENLKIQEITPRQDVKKSEEPKIQAFAGFKKGFLTSSPSAKKPPQRHPDNEPVFIKANPSKQNVSGLFSEVQDALKESNQAWLTDDLLEQIQSNEVLKKGFSNPNLMSKVTQFQNNPQGALKECGNDKESVEFMMEFFKLMGTHMSNMNIEASGTNSKPEIHIKKSEDPEQKKANELLQNSDVKELLLDKEVQDLLLKLKTEPQKANIFLRHANSTMRVKIEKMIQFGLLSFENRE